MRFFNKFKSLMLSMLVVIAMAFAIGCVETPDNNTSNGETKTQAVQSESTIAKSDSDVASGNKETQSSKETQSKAEATKTTQSATKETESKIDKDGYYYSKNEVALYIHTYGKLPSNYITKTEAKKLGWTGGSVEKYAKDKAIGGDSFGNYEGLLPKKNGRKYTECDIDTHGASSRGAKRIIFSNDGLVYYTDNHYASFTLLYGTP